MTSRKRIVENILSLGVLQAANYVLPLVTLPYLVRVLGSGRFGLLAFAQAFIQYFVVLTDYGFNLSATRQISIHRHHSDRVSEIFCTVMIIKVVLTAVSYAMMAIIVALVPKFRADWLVYHVTFLTVVGSAMFPVWLFQGVERMKYITFVNVGSRAITTAAIFMFVHSRSDYVAAALIQSLGWIIAGVLGLCAVRLVFPVTLAIPSPQRIKETLYDGWHVFIAGIASTMFGPTNVFLLGLFANEHIVTYYSIAQKVVKAFIYLCVPINTAVYPRASELFARSRKSALGFLQKVMLIGSAAFLLFAIFLFLGSDRIAALAMGSSSHSVSVLIKIMAIIPLSVFLDGIYGTQIMLNVNMEKEFSHAVVQAAIVSVVLSLVLIPPFGAVGAAYGFLSSQILALLLMVIPIHRAGIELHRDVAHQSCASDGRLDVHLSESMMEYVGSVEEV